jgi:hypothetical protein
MAVGDGEGEANSDDRRTNSGHRLDMHPITTDNLSDGPAEAKGRQAAVHACEGWNPPLFKFAVTTHPE